jgi:hypothetical protein
MIAREAIRAGGVVESASSRCATFRNLARFARSAYARFLVFAAR